MFYRLLIIIIINKITFLIVGGSCYINGDTLNIFRSLSLKWQTKNLVPETMIEQNITVSGLHLGLLFDSNPNKIHYIMEKLFKMLDNNLIKPTIYEIIHFDNVSKNNYLVAGIMLNNTLISHTSLLFFK